eukprot:s497_g36.t1
MPEKGVEKNTVPYPCDQTAKLPGYPIPSAFRFRAIFNPKIHTLPGVSACTARQDPRPRGLSGLVALLAEPSVFFRGARPFRWPQNTPATEANGLL